MATTYIRMLTDSREGNPSKGIPVTTVVPKDTVLPVERLLDPDPHLPNGGYAVRFPDGSLRAVARDKAEVVNA